MKKILSVFFGVLLAAQAWAYDFTAAYNGKTLYYDIINDAEVRLTAQNSSTTIGSPYYYSNTPVGDVEIPQTVKNPNDNKTYTVTQISYSAFAYCNELTSVSIPSTVVEIKGNRLFEDCSGLETITVAAGNSNYSSQDGVLFNKDKTTLLCCPAAKTGSYTIPNTVTQINDQAFFRCTGLTSITIPNTITSIGIDAFLGCTNLTSVTIPNSITSIGSYAFSGCTNMTSVIFATPSSVTSIGSSAFNGCTKLTSVTIPNSVTSIGLYVFTKCTSLTNINVENDNTVYSSENGVLFNKDKTQLICSPAGKTTSSYTIPGSVTSIGTYAFYGCTGLSSVTIPNTVTSIGHYAFYGCTGLSSVTIPNTVTSIANNTFYGCTGLTTVTIPNSVTSIGNSAFYGCTSLTTVTIPNNVTSIGLNAFKNCSNLTSVSIPNSVTSIGSGAFDGCPLNYTTENNCKYLGDSGNRYAVLIGATGTDITSCTIHENCRFINSRAFEKCSKLTSVTIPNSVTSIGEYAFSECSNLTSINIPSAVTSISNYAFNKCSALTTVTFATPSSVTSIGSMAFYNCTKLTSITIPNSVTSIGSDAFRGCSNMTTVTFATPSSVTSIGSGGFYECKLASITLPNSVTSIGSYVFSKCTSLTSISVEDGSTAFTSENGILFNKDKTKLIYYPGGKTETEYNIPNSVTSLSQYAFSYCNSSLTTVTIPNSVTKFESYAFTENSGLTSICIPNSVTSMDHDAIRFCTNATIYCQAEPLPQGWSSSWNNFTKAVKWGCKVVSVASNNDEYGTVSASGSNVAATGYNGSLWYLKETTNGTASLTAIPAEHYTFVKWNDGNTENPRNFTVTASGTYTATFAYKPAVTVNAEHGTVSGDGEYFAGETATIEVTPNHGYVFAGWADDETAPNPRTVTVNSDLELTALFEPDNYEITATAAANGTVEGGGSYAYLSTATLTAKPNDHYYFDHWNSDTDDDENPLTIEVTDDATYTATFAYGPRITYSAEHGTVEGVGTYKPGKTVQLTAVPDAGYYFVKWGDNVTANPRSEVAPASNAADISFTAIFAKGKTISVSGEHGSVNGAGSYKEGSTVTLTAVPDEGYHFVAWGDGVNTASREVTVNDDMELSVTFEINSYTVTANATNGTVSISGSGTYTHGQEATLTATGATGYYFVKWSDNNTENPRTITVTDNVNISATFSNIYTISVTNISNGTVTGAGEYAYGAEATLNATAKTNYHFVRWSDGNKDNPRTITVSANLELSPVFSDKYEIKLIANGKGKVSGGGEYDKDEEITIKATANDHYHFVKWSDGEKQAKRTITVTEDLELTATFDADKFEISVKKTDGGKITGADTYTYGEEVTLKAVPDAGYMFVKWNDDVTKNPRTITVTGDQTYSAEFAPAKYTVTIEVENGTVTGAGDDFAYGAEATLTATPADGYKFVKWSDGNTDNPRTVTITEDLALTAVFELATAIDESEASAVNIYAYGNTIVVENATDEIFVYNAMGALVARTTETEITVGNTGVYIVKTGNTIKRVMVE